MNTRNLAFTTVLALLLSGCAQVSASSTSTPAPTEPWLVSAGPCAPLVEPASRIENAYRDVLESRIGLGEFARQMTLGARDLNDVTLPEPISTAMAEPLAALSTLVENAVTDPTVTSAQQATFWAALEPLTLACRAAGGDLPLRVKNGTEG